MESFYHLPVLPEEVLQYLNIKAGHRILDGTLGGAGHSQLIAKQIGSEGFLWGIDRDLDAITTARQKLELLQTPFQLIHSNFGHLERIMLEHQINDLDGILLDLGTSSHQLNHPPRGFSFQADAELDMRMNQNENTPTAYDLVNTMKQSELVEILKTYGEERFANRIAWTIIQKRPIKSTLELAELIKKVVPYSKSSRIHPATRSFQALRIAVNDELGAIKSALPAAIKSLKSGGRLVVIAFHSLEDKIVKHYFKQEQKDCLCPPKQPICTCSHRKKIKILTKKPVKASPEEIKLNPRSRSACLRVIEKL